MKLALSLAAALPILGAVAFAEPPTRVERDKVDLSELGAGKMNYERSETRTGQHKSVTHSTEVGRVGDHGVSVYTRGDTRYDRPGADMDTASDEVGSSRTVGVGIDF